MGTVTTDQGIPLPTLTDLADGPGAFSANTVGALETRLVKRYASAIDRTARNPTPITNELSTRADNVGHVEYYSGTNWVDLVSAPQIQTLTSAAATVSFTGLTTGKNLVLKWMARSDAALSTVTISIRINADPSAAYFYGQSQVLNATTTNTNTAGGTTAGIGSIMAASSGADQFATGVVEIQGWNAPHPKLNGLYRYYAYDTAPNSFYGYGGWLYNAAGPYTQFSLHLGGGNFVAGSQFTLETLN